MDNFKEKRKNIDCDSSVHFLTDDLQRKFALKFCLVVIMGAVLSGALIYWMSATTLTTVFEHGRLTITNTADFILPAVLLSSLVVIIFIGLFLSLVIWLAYRRLTRSLCQIKCEVEKADAGDLADVHLNFRRKDDEFKVLALSLNKMIQDLKKIIVATKSDISFLEGHCKELEKESPGAVPERLRQDIKRLHEELSGFHI